MQPRSARRHIVLVPGFGGFDALGNVAYYAGVTEQFRHWAGDRAVSLRYFDNLPTAGVATRADRLAHYLATRYARGEIGPNDRIALVGHSTGGLDIRRFLEDARVNLDRPDRTLRVDGSATTGVPVSWRELRSIVDRAVFLSVPQRGTNIADFIARFWVVRQPFIWSGRAGISAARIDAARLLEQLVTRGVLRTFAGAQLANAVTDVFEEIRTHGLAHFPTRLAGALEADADVNLYLRHIQFDFHAILDLRAAARRPKKGTPLSPAHFNDEECARERAGWRAHDGLPEVRTRSYATVGTRVYDFAEGQAAPVWNPVNPLTWPEPRRTKAGDACDRTYRMTYRATAGGPFARIGTPKLTGTPFHSSAQREVTVWDNDGIVTSQSMFYPDGPDTRIVHGDHGDIIGHYASHEVAKDAQDGPVRRKFHSYDILESHSGFNQRRFTDVWRDVFDFCALNEVVDITRKRSA